MPLASGVQGSGQQRHDVVLGGWKIGGGEGDAQAGGGAEAGLWPGWSVWAGGWGGGSIPHFPRCPETPRTVYLVPSHFSLLSLSNAANLCFRKAGAGAAQHLPQNPTLRF